MKFFTVCTRPFYNHTHVVQLYNQLKVFYDGDVEFYCYTDQPDVMPDYIHTIPIMHTKSMRQWYKIDFFGKDIITTAEPVIVMDLDWVIVDDITDIIDTPVRPSEFITVDRWWRGDTDPCPINGGFYKFVPSSCHHLYEIYYTNPKKWQNEYRGEREIGGEQDFVFVHTRSTHTLKFLPSHAVVRWRPLHMENNDQIREQYQKMFGYPLINGDILNPNIRMLHTQHR
jgi:hypothetical protein